MENQCYTGNKKPIISIIIIVKNDRGIEGTLAAVDKQIKPAKTEVLVIDASDSKVLVDIRNNCTNVSWHEYNNTSGKRYTIPEQRNMGVDMAKGELIVFIDANCIPSRNWLTELTKLIFNGQENITAGSTQANDPRTLVNLNPVRLRNDYLFSSPMINLALKKSIFKELGRFDESFFYGSDVDFTWRCIDAGYKIRFIRNAKVTHDWGDFNEEINRVLRYGKARARLYKKHRKRYRKIFKEDISVLIYILWLIGLPIIFLFPINLLFLLYPVTILILVIKNIKYKPFKTVFLNLVHTIGLIVGTIELNILHRK